MFYVNLTSPSAADEFAKRSEEPVDAGQTKRSRPRPFKIKGLPRGDGPDGLLEAALNG